MKLLSTPNFNVIFLDPISHFYKEFCHNHWGDRMIFSLCSSRSGGAAILFNNCPGKVISYKADVHWIVLHVSIEDLFFILIVMVTITVHRTRT